MQVTDVNSNMWTINKKHIVSAVMHLGQHAITRIVLTTDAIIDTYMQIGTINGLILQVEHKTESEEKP